MTQTELKLAAEHLKQNDPVLAPVIDRVGLAKLEPHTNYYWELIDSIISQQLSVHAARSIETRFREFFKSDYPEPQVILKASVEDLRAVGLSRPKVKYIQDLAQHILDGKLSFDGIDGKSNDEIIAELTDVKGIGEWTAHMFLMFSLGRPDVLPVGDLGIRNGVRELYGFKDAPTPEQVTKLARKNNWRPYETVASWYVWQSLDNAPG